MVGSASWKPLGTDARRASAAANEVFIFALLG